MNKTKVLIVDDSATIRTIVKEIINLDPQLTVVGEAKDPFEAREKIKTLQPDIITLDVEMPKMDGITFLSNLMRLRPMPVIMLSTLTTQGADITLQALEIGAIDFIAKPSFEELIKSKDSFKDALLSKLKAAVGIDQRNLALDKARSIKSAESSDFPGSKRLNHLVAIGASTGGTEAIKSLLVNMPENCPPIVITQHIPKAFSGRFASRLNEHCSITVEEAQHGQKIKPGHAYVAPGDLHLTISAKGSSLFCHLNDREPVNRHKPSVDVLYDSLIPIADNVQAILLTGMGQDGAQGMLELKRAGARTIIQSQQSSLIWGMPGSAHALNAHTDELHLDQIRNSVLEFAALNKLQMQKALSHE